MKKAGEIIFTWISIFLFSYLLNYVWEPYHAVFLYKDHNFNAETYIFMLSYSSAIDGIIILSIYLFVAALWRNMLWLKTFSRKQISVAFSAGLVTAASIEYVKVFVMEEWSYGPLMPTLFGIGVSPLLQLGVTGFTAFWLTRRIT